MNRVYPAKELDTLYDIMEKTRKKLIKREKQLKAEFPTEKRPELKDDEYKAIAEEMEEIVGKFESEYLNVLRAYEKLFEDYFITIEEVETMFDLNKNYVERHILSNVSNMYLNRLVRRDIKDYHTLHKKSPLDDVLDANGVDYEKKIFIHYGELVEWLLNHMDSEDVFIDRDVVKYCLQDRKNTVMYNTVTTKKLYDIKYGMQLQRLCLPRIYIKGEDETRPVSRIPTGKLINFSNRLFSEE